MQKQLLLDKLQLMEDEFKLFNLNMVSAEILFHEAGDRATPPPKAES